VKGRKNTRPVATLNAGTVWLCLGALLTAAAAANAQYPHGRSAGDLFVDEMIRVAVPEPDTSAGLRVLRSLELARLSGPFETWYSSGHEERARRIRHMVTGMLDFYHERLDVSIDPYVVVLDSTDWRRLVEAVDACDDCQRINRSYGRQMNWSSPPAIFVPATDSEAAAGVRQGGGELPPLPADVSRELALAGFEDPGMGDLPGFAQDAVALHEIGHLLTRAFEIATPTTWLNEFLANYWWSAYWREDFPALTELQARMTAAAPAAPAQARPSLHDFERGETGGWQNYVWYQGRIGERVDAVLEEHGIRFLTDVRDVLPRDRTGTLSTEEVVERLQTISTGWGEWIASFDSR
jgi:hypothetical protein